MKHHCMYTIIYRCVQCLAVIQLLGDCAHQLSRAEQSIAEQSRAEQSRPKHGDGTPRKRNATGVGLGTFARVQRARSYVTIRPCALITANFKPKPVDNEVATFKSLYPRLSHTSLLQPCCAHQKGVTLHFRVDPYFKACAIDTWSPPGQMLAMHVPTVANLSLHF